MYQRIKTLADEALALQNKGRMEVTLREISAWCAAEIQSFYVPQAMDGEQFEAAELAQHREARFSGPSHGPLTKALMAEPEAVKSQAKRVKAQKGGA